MRDFRPGEAVIYTDDNGDEHNGYASYVPIQPRESRRDDDIIMVSFAKGLPSLPVQLSRVRPSDPNDPWET